jgi:glycosyltransferase involved in cell wall biosynthesis
MPPSKTGGPNLRLAVITTHPIQYYAPWFRFIAETTNVHLKVFYLWDFGVAAHRDHEFGHAIRWDIPLLDGYEYEFVPNVSKRPGVDHFRGIRNPGLARAVRAFSPAAVLLLTYNFESVIRFVAGWPHDIPLLFRGDSHRLEARTGMSQAIKDALIRQLFRRFAACLYVGAANRRYFLEHGVESSRLFFAPHAIDNQRFISQAKAARGEAMAWRAELGIPPAHRVVLFAGKLEPRKCPFDLFHAFVSAGLPRASLLFVGAGSLERPLREVSAGRSDIFFAPFQNQSLMPRTYAAADLYVLPSVHDTWGLAVNEAMCVARPSVVSNLVGCAEDLVRTHETGIVFPARDVNRLRTALCDALDDDDRLRSWGQAAQRLVQNYSYERATTGMLQALATVTGQIVATAS